ncbi:MAG TPA: hypothetical protein VGD59_05160 [Acidisarcina sp.]
MSVAESITTLTLGRAEALVLFEMLADYRDQPCVEAQTPAEKLALVKLHGALETALVEPFMPDYRLLVEEARLELATQAGAV